MSALDRLGARLAEPNPILVKELRATFRTSLFVRFLYLSTAFVALFVLLIGALAASNDNPPATVGQILFHLYMACSLLVIALVAPGYASSAITTEREQQTWESLELSGMSAARIVLGKGLATYAAIALVLVAVTPVVGIAFLFGGVAPSQVLVGFLSLLVALAPAVAFGIAISARLRSTRVAIVLSTLAFFPIAILGTIVMALFGEEARRAWGVALEGPFFYTEAFVARIDHLDTWVALVLAPLYVFGMSVWFLLGSAVAAVRPAAEERAWPMKVWGLVMVVTTLPLVLGFLEVTSHGSTDGVLELWTVATTGPLLLVYGLLFADEPALPPRSYQVRAARFSPLRRALGVLGPGALGGLRFSVLLSFLTSASVAGLVVGYTHHVGAASWRIDLACAVVAAGAFCVAAFVAALSAYLRVALGHGVAARVITLAVLCVAGVLPFLSVVLVEPDSLSGLEPPWLVRLSFVYPLVRAEQLVSQQRSEIASAGIAPCVYAALALVLAVLTHLRVARLARETLARRARWQSPEERA